MSTNNKKVIIMDANKAVEVVHAGCKEGYQYFYNVGKQRCHTRILDTKEEAEKVGKKMHKIACLKHLRKELNL